MTSSIKRPLESCPYVIFLDIDGVLLSMRRHQRTLKKIKELFPEVKPSSLTEEQHDSATAHCFSKKAVVNLSSLITKVQEVGEAAIVVSSNWRKGKSVEMLKGSVFAMHSFSKIIIDKTPEEIHEKDDKTGLSNRAGEIASWLEKHPEVTNFVIFDDEDNNLSERFPENFVHVNIRKLLTDSDVDKAYNAIIRNTQIKRRKPLNTSESVS